MILTPLQKLTDRTESDRFCQSKFHLKSSNSIRYGFDKPSALKVQGSKIGQKSIQNQL